MNKKKLLAFAKTTPPKNEIETLKKMSKKIYKKCDKCNTTYPEKTYQCCGEKLRIMDNNIYKLLLEEEFKEMLWMKCLVMRHYYHN